MKNFLFGNKLSRYAVLQSMSELFSFGGVLIKVASLRMVSHGLISRPTLAAFVSYILVLAIYAFFCQKVIKRVPLTTAYLSKGTLLFWSLLWAWIIFEEQITATNLLGTAIIAAGTVLVNTDE